MVGPRRYHGTVQLDPARVGRDASHIAEEVIAHLVGLAGSEVKVTLDIEARLPDGASEHVPRTVTVTAGNDADLVNETVSLTHSATSTDSDYSGIAIAGVTVTVNDNDTPR